MKNLFFRLPMTVRACFTGWPLAIQLLAFFLTWVIVVMGLDWQYFLLSRSTALRTFFFPALVIGGLLPVLGLLAILLVGHAYKNTQLKNTAWALGQSVLLGWTISSSYKFFTGRLQPNVRDVVTDISNTFRFGIFRGGIFWGWPSSHTTIAFAMAFTLVWLYRKNSRVIIPALIYAAYIGVGVATVGIHWLSEAVAGALIGGVMGLQVGKVFEGRARVQAFSMSYMG